MIPVRLKLKDFLSYASPEPLDFTSFQVACLSGDNGAGKSALLDAITWAVWGCARGCEGGQNQERLIRDGAEDMEVEFVFELGGSAYRVIRRRSRTRRPELAFSVRDGDGWKTIAGETLKETDEKIASVLRMDYKTFTASAFFVQGRSEDFLARMKPDERKDVFARLLDLGTYERLEDRARERARDADRERKDVAGRIERLTETMPDIAAIEAQLTEVALSMKQLDERSVAADADLRRARDELAQLQATAATLTAEREALVIARNDAAGVTRRAAELGRELDDLDALLARSDEVAAALAETEALVVEEAAAQERRDRAAALDAQRAELAATIDSERRAIERRCDDLRSRIAVHEEEIASITRAQAELAQVDAALGGAVDPEPALTGSRDLLGSLSAEGARLKEQISQLDIAESKARRNIEVLADGGGECPVCGSALDAEHRSKVKRDIEREIVAIAASRDAANAELEAARKEAMRVREDIKRLEQASTERAQLLVTREGLAGRLERMDAVTGEHAQLAATLATDLGVLSAETFAMPARAALAALEDELSGLYDAAAHTALRRRLEELAPYAALAGRLEEAANGRRRIVTEIETATAREAELQRAIELRTDAIAVLEAGLTGLEAALEAVEAGEKTLDGLRHAAADAAAEHARLSERLAHTKTMAADLDAARAEERTAADAHRRYRRLVEAFGPAGIPKLIIDNALPELTDDTNRILGRLSDHEMSIQFVLQRDTKAGKPKETFEALVHHDGGVRDFAMFSGGEAFRVAFAVRLAMSKLLVRRAGARLETLVIDEGFGSQDPEGRERLVEAINLARLEFAKVLVITHLEELKDQFGTQIRVEKGISGSSLELVES